MIHNILHISDLHYNDDEKSYLTNDSETFINELVKEINSVESRIDYLFITGDIANKGIWKGNSKVLKILNKLETDLNIKSTFCINGNHDLNKSGFVSSKYNSFKSKLNLFPKPLKYSWFTASKICDNHWVIEIDCFINGKDSNYGTGFTPLSNKQFSEFEEFLSKKTKTGLQTFYILSHLPVVIDPQSKLSEDSRFLSRCIWPDGEALLKIINRMVDVNMISWFAGDGHVVDAYKKPDYQEYYFLTGRFNGPNEKWKEEYFAKEAHCQFVRCDTTRKEIIRTIKFSTTQEHYGSYSVKWYSSTLEFISKAKYVNRYFDSRQQKDLRKLIFDTISKENLYSLTKATTKEKNVTLGWVDVNGLLNHGNVLQSFLETAHDLLLREFKKQFNNYVIIGLGYWGSSIASFLGCSLNIPTYPLKIRSIDLSNNKSFVSFVRNKNILICADVVASGETLNYIKRVGNFNEITCLITVMLNPKIQSKLRDVNKIIYGSNEIAFPQIEQINLPETICESNYRI